ncbi:pirin family protein [Frankia sp. AgKG'84/4]|uniref:pirin family protein n=1 Tax=Frankia sp. AgKG'84/4 TaxID=573490 RepID=UPI00200DF0CE|nr:pirin family protein [Frankia sp. AgKG'84/4]MCL9793749.1 pirin family protein [Frankia sp. AgKG'84/4]
MSGPVSPVDVTAGLAVPSGRPVPGSVAPQVIESRTAEVGGLPVRRALPHRVRRTVGAWCFVDHLGPVTVSAARPVEIGPHPHIGLATVTWLVSGRLLHLDSLGSEQLLRPGQLNLMTAGHGVAHAEVSEAGPGAPGPGELQGVQLWIAQPESTRHGPPAFAHHADLPTAGFGAIEATVLLGELGDVTSPARTDSALVGAELVLRGGGVIPLRRGFEHALVVLTGAVRLGDRVLTPGRLAYLGAGLAELDLAGEAGTRAMLLGGEPFTEPLVMWWNLVARSHAEIDAAHADWQAGTERFGPVATTVTRTVAPRPPWSPGPDEPRRRP